MVLDDIFERFARQSPVTVMVRAALEHTLSPQALDALFEQTAEQQYTRTLLFSSIVNLVGAVVARIQPAVDAAYRARSEALGISLRAVYDKLDRTEPGVSAELVRHTARSLGPVITAMGGERAAWLPGYRVKILDGNHLAGTQHGATLFIEEMGERRFWGRSETGAVFEREIRLGDGNGGTMTVRRITVELDTPT